MTLETQRATAMKNLTCCPVCASEIVSAEISDTYEVVEFACYAALYRQAGAATNIARTCPSPTYVAVAQLERDAERMVEA